VVDFARHDADHEYVGTLWAARRIGALTRTMRLEGATEQRIEEIRTLALRHGIVTEYTAYLVLEPERSSADIASAPGRRRSDGSQPPSAAPSSVQQTGRGAFEAAQTSADYAVASTVGEAKKVSARAQMRSEQDNGSGARAQQRLVGSRRYEQRGEQWADIGQRSQRIVTVEAFSSAYFALLQALPELRDASQLGDDVLVAGRRVSIRIQRTGQQSLAGSEVMQLAKDFRGA
jgi:hypothetical protein